MLAQFSKPSRQGARTHDKAAGVVSCRFAVGIGRPSMGRFVLSRSSITVTGERSQWIVRVGVLTGGVGGSTALPVGSAAHVSLDGLPDQGHRRGALNVWAPRAYVLTASSVSYGV